MLPANPTIPERECDLQVSLHCGSGIMGPASRSVQEHAEGGQAGSNRAPIAGVCGILRVDRVRRAGLQQIEARSLLASVAEVAVECRRSLDVPPGPVATSPAEMHPPGIQAGSQIDRLSGLACCGSASRDLSRDSWWPPGRIGRKWSRVLGCPRHGLESRNQLQHQGLARSRRATYPPSIPARFDVAPIEVGAIPCDIGWSHRLPVRLGGTSNSS